VGDEETVFTGERVIPGAVEPDLWNEHVARYRFASLLAAERHVLDAGCGTGYGAAAMASVASGVWGFDTSLEAVRYATRHYGEHARFCLGSADAFPARSTWFDLVTAFEVIEHISTWPELISEAARVLKPTGAFLVSTPNKSSYAESRKEVGVNPFHVHEFDQEEFRSALEEKFRFVKILAQNQQSSVVVAGEAAGQYGEVFVENKPSLQGAQFFLAVCSFQRIPIPSFAYIPSGSNLLQERERYIESLKRELDESRRQLRAARTKLDELHAHLEERTQWAQSLDQRAMAAEVEVQRTSQLLRNERNAVRSSRWFKLGEALNVGPKLPDDPA
jgi:SAM-dependent methyltransferase